MLTILLSNDDGVDAPGLNQLAQALWDVANVIVVAPNSDQSGASHSLTLSRPLRLSTMSNGFISVNGTPSDCVHIAITGFLDKLPDMVVSGINSGPNLGDDVMYSGTVAAAMEGRFLGYPAIAVSSLGTEPQHFDCAARVTLDIIEKIKKNPLPSNIILNVNVPAVPYEELQGWKITRLGERHIAEPVIRQKDPRGRDVFWIGLPGPENYAGEDTDFYAVTHGYVSLTPLLADFTAYQTINQLREWVGE